MWSALIYTSAALEFVRKMVGGLQIDPARMRANVELTQGLIMAEALTMALARHVGRPEAQRMVKALIERAVKSGRHLIEVAKEDEEVSGLLSLEEFEKAFVPGAYMGSTDVFIERALEAYREMKKINSE